MLAFALLGGTTDFVEGGCSRLLRLLLAALPPQGAHGAAPDGAHLGFDGGGGPVEGHKGHGTLKGRGGL